MPYFWGGGGNLSNLYAVTVYELNKICTGSECYICSSGDTYFRCDSNMGGVRITPNQNVENHTTITSNVTFYGVPVDTFTNGTNGVIKSLSFLDSKDSYKINSFGGLSHLINYGTITEGIAIDTSLINNVTIHNYGNIGNILYSGYRNSASTMYVYNEGTMGGINHNSASTNTTVIINNVGVMGIIGADRIIIDKYVLTINQPRGKQFNAISWYDGFNCGNDCIDDKESFYSHLLIKSNKNTVIGGKDANSKIILDFGERFELGEKYLLDKIILDTSTARKYNVPLSFLALKTPIFMR